MLMGYLYLKCARCEKVIRHHAKDVEIRKVRICPGCGEMIEVSKALSPPPAE